ncbi:MAG: dienelactone hydrolase family protein [Defluviicoccus sp.]|nr:dienelactone hydrolase family protein [Defluviicoccus sp.]MDE0385979.1 dienelactone hydrolase family protein [Defluviicoccus sp.]
MANLIQLAGPEAGPASVGTPDSLVVLVHGYGADGNDLIGLAPHFAQTLPGTAFVSPHAPQRCEMAPFGRQWFNVWNEDPVSRLAEIRHAAAILDGFIDERIAALGIAEDRLALLGFSQGTMMSLFVAPRRAAPCAGVLGYSGRLEGADLLAAETVSRPPVVLVHGDSDELLPLHRLQHAEAALTENGFDVAAHVRPGLGHGIDEAGIGIGRRFLASRLGTSS